MVNASNITCIVGMHRSGTSMVTRLLHECGLYLGKDDDIMPPHSDDNPEGYWEHNWITELNDEILSVLEGSWDKPPNADSGWYDQPEIKLIVERFKGITASFSKHDWWGWKDPRNSLTLDLWLHHFPDAYYVMCARNPIEVAKSLSVGNPMREMEEDHALELWKQYYEQIFLALHPDTKIIVTHYSSYFYDPEAELRRILAFLGQPINEDRIQNAVSTIRTDLKHHFMPDSVQLSSNIPRPIAQYYERLCAQAGDVYERMVTDDTHQLNLAHQHIIKLDKQTSARWQQAQQDLTQLRITHDDLAARYEQLRQEDEALRQNLADLHGQLEAAQQQRDESHHKLTQALTDHETTQQQLAQAIQQHDESQQQLTQALSEQETTQQQLAQVNSEHDAIQQQLAQVTRQRDDTGEQLAQTVTALEDTQAQLAQTISERDESQQQLTQISGERDEIHQQLQDTIHARDDLHQQLAQAIDERDESRNQLAQTLADHDNLQQQLAQATSQYSQLQETLQIQLAQFSTLSQELQQLATTNNQLATLNERITSERDTLRQDIKALQTSYDALKQDIDVLREEHQDQLEMVYYEVARTSELREEFYAKQVQILQALLSKKENDIRELIEQHDEAYQNLITEKNNEISAYHQQINELREHGEDRDSLVQIVESLRAELSESRSEFERVHNDLNEHKQYIQYLQHELATVPFQPIQFSTPIANRFSQLVHGVLFELSRNDLSGFIKRIYLFMRGERRYSGKQVLIDDFSISKHPPVHTPLLEPPIEQSIPSLQSAQNSLQARFSALQPLQMFHVSQPSLRLNLVTDSINMGSLFGGVATSIILATLLANRLNCELRVITRSEPPHKQSFSSILRANALGFDKNIEFIYANQNDPSLEIPVSTKDIFLTTSWWTTESIRRSVSSSKILYLLQEDERSFYPFGDDHIRCTNVLRDQNITFIVNSKLLYDHMIAEGFQNIKDSGFYFEPSWPKNLYFREKSVSNKKNFFYYARPDHLRNLYYLGLEVLQTAITRGILSLDEWAIHFVGANVQPTRLNISHKAIVHQNMMWDDYARLVRQMDLGLSLMYSAHPSYPPLDLVASGAVAVTNKYSNKQTLNSYSKNLLCYDLDVESLVIGIQEGIDLANDQKKRLKNYTKSQIQRDWQKSFAPILGKITDKIVKE